MFVVTTPATDLTLLTIAELRTAVALAATDNSRDGALIPMGARVAAVIAKACKVAASGILPPTLRQESLTETFRLKSHQDRLILSRRPIVSVTSITEADQVLASTDYEIDAGAGILQRLCQDNLSCWPRGKIVVAYSAGWLTVPDDLKLAASKLAAAFWSEGQKVDSSLKRVSIPGVIDKEYWVGPSDDPAIPQEVMDLLSPYMNHTIG